MNIKQMLTAIAAKLVTVAQKVPQVYEAGKQEGGKEFMEEYQANHIKINSSSYAFAGVGWTNNTFHPTKDIKGSAMVNVFMASQISGDLVEILDEHGVVFDSSKCTNCNGFFQYALFTRLGVIDCTKSSGAVTGLFSYCYYLKTIDLFKIKADGSQQINNCFIRCDALESLTMEGVIGKNGLNLSACKKLNKASHLNVVGIISTTASVTVTFSKVAVDKAFETAPGANDGSTSQEWNDLVDTRPNATIVLA